MRTIFYTICFLLLGLGPYTTVQAQDLPIINLDSDKGSYVRFQIPGPGQSTADARVSTLVWNQDTSEVTSTCLNFANLGGTNVQLWRSWGLSTLFYAGIFEPDPTCDARWFKQDGLNSLNVAVTVILPSGVDKLDTVGPDQTGWGKPDKLATQGIFGIKGVLQPSDYAYFSVSAFRSHFVNWGQLIVDRGDPADLTIGAVRGDGTKVYLLTRQIPERCIGLIGMPQPLP
jgi:hypothetical protein